MHHHLPTQPLTNIGQTQVIYEIRQCHCRSDQGHACCGKFSSFQKFTAHILATSDCNRRERGPPPPIPRETRPAVEPVRKPCAQRAVSFQSDDSKYWKTVPDINFEDEQLCSMLDRVTLSPKTSVPPRVAPHAPVSVAQPAWGPVRSPAQPRSVAKTTTAPKPSAWGPVSQPNNSRLVPATSPIPPPKPNTTSRQGTHVAPSTTRRRSSVSTSGLSYTSGSSMSSPLVQPTSAKTKKKKGKFYVVTKGRAVGVFDHW